jgi:hypothetical protein
MDTSTTSNATDDYSTDDYGPPTFKDDTEPKPGFAQVCAISKWVQINRRIELNDGMLTTAWDVRTHQGQQTGITISITGDTDLTFSTKRGTCTVTLGDYTLSYGPQFGEGTCIKGKGFSYYIDDDRVGEMLYADFLRVTKFMD